MDPYMDPIWTLYVDPRCIVHESLCGPYMDPYMDSIWIPLWILYGSL